MRQVRENDAGQRALVQMMGGTLKTKKDLSALEITLDREPWMDQIPFDDMTDLQKQALKEFEEKEKALAEEQDKYRKQLHAELARLRTENTELTQQFEGILKQLHHELFAHDAKSFCQELYCVRLQLALLQSVEDSHVLEQSQKDAQEANVKLRGADARFDNFKASVSNMKERQEKRQQHEKEVASVQYFKQQFTQSNLEPQFITDLLHLFRRKKDKHRHSLDSPEPPGELRKSITRRATMGFSNAPVTTVPVADQVPAYDPSSLSAQDLYPDWAPSTLR